MGWKRTVFYEILLVTVPSGRCDVHCQKSMFQIFGIIDPDWVHLKYNKKEEK